MNDVHYSHKTIEWETPQALFDELNAEFAFTLDPCATAENTKCDRYYTVAHDGLAQDWTGERVFCNPPYGRVMGQWIEKCASGGAEVAVMLIPARTDTKAFHEHIYHNPHAEIRFLRGRLKFGNSTNSAPFPSMIVIFRR